MSEGTASAARVYRRSRRAGGAARRLSRTARRRRLLGESARLPDAKLHASAVGAHEGIWSNLALP
jgi:hypothetical protein